MATFCSGHTWLIINYEQVSIVKFYLSSLLLNPGQTHVLSVSREPRASDFERVYVLCIVSLMDPKFVIFLDIL